MSELTDFSLELKQLNSRIYKIQDEASEKINELIRSYAIKSAVFNIGDVIQSDHYIIVIDKIRWSKGEEDHRRYGKETHRTTVDPYCVYFGRELTKKLTLKKSGDVNRLIGGRKIDLTSEQRLTLQNEGKT